MQFYGFPVYNIRLNESPTPKETLPLEKYTFPSNLQNALSIIRDSLKNEKNDETFYTILITIAPNREAQDILKEIRDDEIKHRKMLRLIYLQITNDLLPEPKEDAIDNPRSYFEGIKKAIKEEHLAVERYRKVFNAMRSRVHINMVLEIITDELKHGSLYNLLYIMGTDR